MSRRTLFLAAYDIADDHTRAAALARVRALATGGQKSVHEVFLTPAERDELLHDMALILNEATDRFLLLRLDPRARVRTLGAGMPPADPAYFYVG